MQRDQPSFFKMTRSQLACIPVLILWPVIVYLVPMFIPLTLIASLLIYFWIGRVTNCVWPCVLAFLGALVGLAFDPPVKGGSHESQMWETVSYYGIGAGIGLFLGLLTKIVKEAVQLDLEEMDQTHQPSPQ